ncbi:MAG: peptidase [Altererythrobacter sp.]|nr:peptidase [Altererythrobacter sp.]
MRGVRRTLFLTHRWLGVALSLLMALWALSGFVMMYVSYPETSATERTAGLDPLDLSACCDHVDFPDDPVDRAAIEMVAGRPVLRWFGPAGPELTSLAGPAAPEIGEREAAEIARTYMRNTFGTDPALRIAPVDGDQWTISVRRYAPLWKAQFADARGSVLYVSGLTGQVVQDTHASERFWNWLGAVPHWLYFRTLRDNGPLWSQVVIYTSLLGTFLTVTGLYVGIVTWRRRGKRWSPFRGVALWHHWLGLVFGLVTLTWVFSGFASMNPWGWLAGDGPGQEMQSLAGRPIEGGDVEALTHALAAHPRPGVVSAEVTVRGGRAWAVLVGRDGERTRASLPDLTPAPLADVDLARLGSAAKPGTPIASQGMIAQGDAYHYSHHSTPALLPAWRVIYGDADATRLYFDPRTGELIGFVDADSRAFRWWHLALHRLDFSVLRERPLWDIVVLPLLAGVSLLCLLGAWMGVKRLTRRRRPNV